MKHVIFINEILDTLKTYEPNIYQNIQLKTKQIADDYSQSEDK